jgi:uncharacterized membrane protein
MINLFVYLFINGLFNDAVGSLVQESPTFVVCGPRWLWQVEVESKILYEWFKLTL